RRFLRKAEAFGSGSQCRIVTVEAQADFAGRFEAQPLTTRDSNSGVCPRHVGGYHHGSGVARGVGAPLVLAALLPLATPVPAATALIVLCTCLGGAQRQNDQQINSGSC